MLKFEEIDKSSVRVGEFNTFLSNGKDRQKSLRILKQDSEQPINQFDLTEE